MKVKLVLTKEINGNKIHFYRNEHGLIYVPVEDIINSTISESWTKDFFKNTKNKNSFYICTLQIDNGIDTYTLHKLCFTKYAIEQIFDTDLTNMILKEIQYLETTDTSCDFLIKARKLVERLSLYLNLDYTYTCNFLCKKLKEKYPNTDIRKEIDYYCYKNDLIMCDLLEVINSDSILRKQFEVIIRIVFAENDLSCDL